MINIKQALKNIKSAFYGNEVRDSIHDAIYLINEKAESAVSSASASKDSAKAYAEIAGNSANESKEYSDQASGYAEESKQYSITASSKASDASESAQSAANSVDLIKEALETDIPHFEVDFETGHLNYTGAIDFEVNDYGHLLWAIA